MEARFLPTHKGWGFLSQINENEPWESAPFAWVSSYDPTSSSPVYVHMIDLRHITKGIIKYYDGFCTEQPSWLDLKECINIKRWNKDWPIFEICEVNTYSTVDGTICGDHGWNKEQLDYFSWANENPDPRSLREKDKAKLQQWYDSHHTHILKTLLDIHEDNEELNKIAQLNSQPYSLKEAMQLAKNNPKLFKQLLFFYWTIGSRVEHAYMVAALKTLLVNEDESINENIKEVLIMAAEDRTNNFAQQEAIIVLGKALGLHSTLKIPKVKKAFRKLSRTDNKYIKNTIIKR